MRYCECHELNSQVIMLPGRDPLQWATRVQIALDSARGLEYIHEHTVPVYIHRDIKSANILVDKNFRAKVECFQIFIFIIWIIMEAHKILIFAGC